jgi:hypothetical protein
LFLPASHTISVSVHFGSCIRWTYSTSCCAVRVWEENRACECFDIRRRAEYLHLRDMKWQNNHSKETHKSVRFTEYIRMIMNNPHYHCYTKLS